MLDFRQPLLSDRILLEQILKESGRIACDYTFGNILMWSVPTKTKIAIFGGTVFSFSALKEGVANYCFPTGTLDLKSAVEILIKDSQGRSLKMMMSCLTKTDVQLLEDAFPSRFTFVPVRENFDYIYSVPDLANLAGAKFHSKRNHIAGFKNTYDWRYETIDEKNIALCHALNDKWEHENDAEHSAGLTAEEYAINIALEHFFELGFRGGILFADGEPAAYTIGEEINSDYFCTHFEKAFPQIRGSYTAINHEFALNALGSYKFVNREDDTGDEGLRKAKLSYHPALLLEKYNAFLKD